MVAEQIQNIIIGLSSKEKVELIETHISWVILGEEHVYKIKKPVQYSFVDFSTVEKRKYYCERELMLNRRLTTGMYLDVVPIRLSNGLITIDTLEGQLIDYAVKMKRMDETRQMNLLLENNLVTKDHMDPIAAILSGFHQSTEHFFFKVDIDILHNDFADILHSESGSDIAALVESVLDASAVQLLQQSIVFSKSFLKKHQGRLQERNDLGFTVDGHGDLHSRNIFILDDPVIFDCIEFNDHFRRLDLLDELAFFCMDLDLYERSDLARSFMLFYESRYPCRLNHEDQLLYRYYKLYRANVKIKVNALKTLQMNGEKEAQARINLLERYFRLFQKYFKQLQLAQSPE
ncbi:MAG: hypothetical protein KJP00_08805 [Bacteroidia bacterium]|nr:hypothetical protein [Bacteroidia bacterium]